MKAPGIHRTIDNFELSNAQRGMAGSREFSLWNSGRQKPKAEKKKATASGRLGYEL